MLSLSVSLLTISSSSFLTSTRPSYLSLAFSAASLRASAFAASSLTLALASAASVPAVDLLSSKAPVLAPIPFASFTSLLYSFVASSRSLAALSKSFSISESSEAAFSTASFVALTLVSMVSNTSLTSASVPAFLRSSAFSSTKA